MRGLLRWNRLPTERVGRRRSSKWPPTIADIAGIMAEYAAKVPDPESVLRAILDACHSGPRQPKNLHPVALAVIDAMGWDHIMDSENPEALRAHILRMATTYRRRALQAANLSAAGLELPVECQPVLPEGDEPVRAGRLLEGFLGADEREDA